MNDENNYKILIHYIGLRSKKYTFKVVGKLFKKSKGVNQMLSRIKYLEC